MANLNPPPQSADANLDRWLNLLHKRVIAPVVTVGQLGNYADDAAAAAAGVPINGLYRTGSTVMVRVA